MTDLTPREIVSELDRFIIGQKDAKRAVAVALRNRWRRKQLSDDLREEVQKQLRHLERQAATAQKYKALREEERRARAELLVLRLDAMLGEIEQRDAATANREFAEQLRQWQAPVATSPRQAAVSTATATPSSSSGGCRGRSAREGWASRVRRRLAECRPSRSAQRDRQVVRLA